jgi:hypothetical protein
MPGPAGSMHQVASQEAVRRSSVLPENLTENLRRFRQFRCPINTVPLREIPERIALSQP